MKIAPQSENSRPQKRMRNNTPKRVKVQHENQTENRLESKQEMSGENMELVKDDGKKKVETMFDDSNIDYNLYTAAPQNIIEKKIMLGNNLLVLSKMMDAVGDKGQSYEYPAISFQRKCKSQKAYTFNLPLNLAPTLIRALELIMEDNKTFFSHLSN